MEEDYLEITTELVERTKPEDSSKCGKAISGSQGAIGATQRLVLHGRPLAQGRGLKHEGLKPLGYE
jgi:hypothetical protein